MTTPFAITYDYRCPFARNAHEHVMAALGDGAPWEVSFVPFSLGQVHVAEGEPSVWDDPEKSSSLLATEAGMVVRDRYPERFPAVHLALFTARHDQSMDIRQREVVAGVLRSAGADADAVLAEVDSGWPRDAFRKEHEAAVAGHRVFGVPTFILGDEAVFVRLNTRPQGDPVLARTTVDLVLGMIGGHPELNEFKHTSLVR